MVCVIGGSPWGYFDRMQFAQVVVRVSATALLAQPALTVTLSLTRTLLWLSDIRILDQLGPFIGLGLRPRAKLCRRDLHGFHA
jgi:hypothetical protein